MPKSKKNHALESYIPKDINFRKNLSPLRIQKAQNSVRNFESFGI